MERRLQEKEEELENLRKNMQFEIDRLTAALADAEARMKSEISRLKKKYQAEIAELEMTVDNLNRANIEAQKTIKKQSEQLKVLQASLEDTQRQLQQTLDQYALAQRKVSALAAELEEAKNALDNAIRARKQAEIDLEEAHGRINDLQSINNNLTAIKNKLETELSTAQADLDEATKELHAADERANRALADAARAVEQLHEEQEHSMKIDALRKSLEEQVKQLQVQIQEAEAAALLGGKRVIAKLETRIRDLETALDEETRRHKETQNALRKKDRRIKEVQMQVDEEHKNFVMAQDTADRLLEKLNIQKRQLGEAESITMQNLQRVRRYQRELEDAEGRADQAESSLHLIRAKHRSSVVTGKGGSSPKVYVLEED
jgi:chromosome segregation ATPase